jgi:hypothetical protein
MRSKRNDCDDWPCPIDGIDDVDGIEGGEGSFTKTCPRCGEELFRDMDICYGCLYDFTRRSDLPSPAAGVGPRVGDLPDGWDSGLPPMEAELGLDDPISADETQDLSPAAHPVGIRVRDGFIEMSVPLGDEPITVGRLRSCSISLNSCAVSRRHLRFTRTAHGVLAEDLGSKNPAVFQGRPIRDGVYLVPGDTVGVCGAYFTIIGAVREAAVGGAPRGVRRG